MFSVCLHLQTALILMFPDNPITEILATVHKTMEFRFGSYSTVKFDVKINK